MLKVWNGTAWKSADFPRAWSGTAFKRAKPMVWDGEYWQPQAYNVSSVSLRQDVTFDVAAPTPAATGSWHTGQKSFAATWGGSYRQDNALRTDTTDLYQGLYTAINGNQKSLVGFNVSGIPAGATIVAATLSVTAAHWYSSSGGTLIIGTHSYSNKPGSWTGAGTGNRQQYAWDTKTGQRSISLTSAVGQDLLEGSQKGVLFGPGLSSSKEYYGYMVGTGGSRPSLTLKYRWFA
jgi:hypothetical protein